MSTTLLTAILLLCVLVFMEGCSWKKRKSNRGSRQKSRQMARFPPEEQGESQITTEITAISRDEYTNNHISTIMSDQYEEMHKSHAQRKQTEAANMARDRMNTQESPAERKAEEEVRLGDYVLATKYNDGDAQK